MYLGIYGPATQARGARCGEGLLPTLQPPMRFELYVANAELFLEQAHRRVIVETTVDTGRWNSVS